MSLNVGAAAAIAAAAQQKPADDSPIWLRYTVKFVAIGGSLIALGLGIMAILGLCLLGGIMQMLVAFTILLIEAPLLCPFLDFAHYPGNFMDKRPLWMRSLLYIVLSTIPIFLCIGFSTFFGSGLLFVAGTLYGVMALGKKASSDEMRERAASMSDLLVQEQAKNMADKNFGQQQVP